MRKSFNNYDAVKNEEQNAQPKQAAKALGDGQLVAGKRLIHHQSSVMNKSSHEFQSIGNGAKFLNQQPSGGNGAQQMLRQGGLSSSMQFFYG